MQMNDKHVSLTDKIIQNDTCFAAHKRHQVNCQRTNCKFWIEHEKFQNCSLIASEASNRMTLEQIGKIFGLTRMRVCQIEKSIKRKIMSLLLEHQP
jgi:hypothetical protein